MALKLSNLEYSNDLGNPIVASVGKRSIEDCITIVNDALNNLVSSSPYSYKISVGKIKVVDGGLFKKTQIPALQIFAYGMQSQVWATYVCVLQGSDLKTYRCPSTRAEAAEQAVKAAEEQANMMDEDGPALNNMLNRGIGKGFAKKAEKLVDDTDIAAEADFCNSVQTVLEHFEDAAAGKDLSSFAQAAGNAGGFCPNCGAPVEAGAAFCPSCGNKLA